MPTLNVAPQTVEPGEAVDVIGAGFVSRQKITLSVDGGTTDFVFRAGRDGTFRVGVQTGSLSTIGTHSLDAYDWVRRQDSDTTNDAPVASTTFTIAKASPPPPPDDPPPPPDPEPPIVLVLQGYGSEALYGITLATTAIVTSASQFLDAFARLGSGLDRIMFPEGAKLDLDLGSSIRRLDKRSGFVIDGGGADVTFRGGPLWFEGCHHFALINVRHRGGWKGGQAADDITIAGKSHDVAIVNVSVSGAADEGLSTTRECWNVTYQDVLFGPGQAGHNYGSLNDYQSHELSIIRCGFVGLEYRNPKVGFHGDSNSGSKPPTITADVVNRVVVDCDYGITVHSGALVNDTNPYAQNVAHKVDGPAHGAVIGGQSVASWAQVPALSPKDAALYVKERGGCLPHDAFDAALVARIKP